MPSSTSGLDAGDYGMVLTAEAKRYAVTAPLAQAVAPSDDKPLVVQYEVKLQEGLSCGGAYVKLYDASVSPATVTPESPYVIMFGPDRCGSTDKVHFIIKWKNPVTGDVEEKHLTSPPRTVNDKLSHLYTLVLTPDSRYKVRRGCLGAAEEQQPSAAARSALCSLLPPLPLTALSVCALLLFPSLLSSPRCSLTARWRRRACWQMTLALPSCPPRRLMMPLM